MGYNVHVSWPKMLVVFRLPCQCWSSDIKTWPWCCWQVHNAVLFWVLFVCFIGGWQSRRSVFTSWAPCVDFHLPVSQLIHFLLMKTVSCCREVSFSFFSVAICRSSHGFAKAFALFRLSRKHWCCCVFEAAAQAWSLLGSLDRRQNTQETPTRSSSCGKKSYIIHLWTALYL